MTYCIALLTDDKGKGQIDKISQEATITKIFIFTNRNETFNEKCQFFPIDPNASVHDLIITMNAALKDKINDTEVALNLVSGTGKEHMALLSAVLKLGVGIRLLAYTKNGVEEL